MSMICVVASLMIFTSCGSNNVTNVLLRFNQEDISFNEKSSDTSNKKRQYELKTVYGIEINFDNFNLYCVKEKDGNIQVNKKTDTTAGYTLESNMPENPNAGMYNLTFSYEGWENIVDVIIEKKDVDLPHFENYESDVFYTGADYTNEIIYDTATLEMLEPDIKRVEPIEANGDYYAERYYVEFALKDKINYKWPDGVAVDINENGNYVFSFAIKKVFYEAYVSDVSESITLSRNELSLEKFESLKKTEEINRIIINGTSLSNYSDYLHLIISDDSFTPHEVTEIDNTRIQYYMMLVVNDKAHQEVVKTTEIGNTQAYIGNPREFIIVTVIDVTN